MPRPKPRIASIDEVTISRDGEYADIVYHDPAVGSMNLKIGPEIDSLTDHDILDCHNRVVAAFYECDAGALGCCDDSGGSVGDVFRFDARELFVIYAARCANKKWLGNLVLRLMESDSYGVRDVLIDCATEYLPEEVMREMVSRMLELADREAGEYQKRHWLHGVESLARQLKDAPLFERARLASWNTLSTAFFCGIFCGSNIQAAYRIFLISVG